MDEKNLAVGRQQFAHCVFNHKVQEKAVERVKKINTKIKWANIVVLAIVIVFLVLQISYPENFVFGEISISITIFEILFLFIQKEFSFEDKEKEHKKIALNFLKLRNKYMNFITDIMNEINEQEIISKRNLLSEQYEIITSLATQTEEDDYKSAQIALLGKNNISEEYTWSEEEIDSFLPNELKLFKKQDLL